MPEISRRKLLRYGLVAGATLSGGSLVPRLASAAGHRPGSKDLDGQLLEATVLELQRAMGRGRFSSVELTDWYLARIADLNPELGAVIETNPDALWIARKRDGERSHGRVRGPLHGIPVLIKDNIATADSMETTAGSLALVGSQVPRDAVIIDRLRKAGAIILGKANLSEWANFRGGPSISGWSARGGFTRSPYDLAFDPTGSSSGSAVAAAANLTSLAVGTETDGSITAPAAEAAVVGMKPTLGLISQKGIIPIASSQDTAGPMARTVTDAALLLNVLRSPFGEVRGHRLPRDYTACLNPKALKGARLAYDHRYVEGDFGPLDDELLAVVDKALDEMRKAGAVIDDVTTTDPTVPTADGRVPFDDEFTVLLFEFKVQIAQYLARLKHTTMRTLADLIAFNLAHCDEEMRYFGQEVFELAEATNGDLTDPEYLAAWRTNRGFGRTVIDSLLAQGYQAVITPSFSFGTSNPAVAGYPSISVPVGFTAASRPVGIWLAAGFLQEPTLLGLAYATEQLLQGRRPPELLGAPPVYPDAGICAPPAVVQGAPAQQLAFQHDLSRRSRRYL
jgi:amidase